jgi:hypothetical protein
MLVPLETLSGWPQVPNPTVLQSLTLLVGIPLLISVIVIAIIEIGARARARRGDAIDTSDPLWVGARESAEVEPVSDSKGAEATAETTPEPSAAGARAATSAAESSAAESSMAKANVEGGDSGEHLGGAGARW